MPDAIDRARFGGIAWLPGNKSFLYNRLQKLTPDMPRTAFEQRSRVYVHELGRDPEQDRFVFGYGYSADVKIDDNDLSFASYTRRDRPIFWDSWRTERKTKLPPTTSRWINSIRRAHRLEKAFRRGCRHHQFLASP